MWMMGCNDGSGFNMSDSFNSRKLRPLMPRPISYCPNTATATPPPCLSSLHGADLFGSNNHMASPTEQSKQEFSAQPVVSSRWNPTPEQLGTLEELYRQGTRTPTAEQIQHITAQLRRFGKIEGKNVFYWFQNHKARERQKRRRQLESNAGEQQFCEIQSFERKESGSSRTSFEVEQTRNWAHPTNCSTLAQESVSMQRAAVAESRIDGWIQIEQGELHQRRSSIERHATWPMMQLSCSHPSQLLNTITTTTTEAMTTVDPRLISNQNLNIFITATRENQVDGQNSEECREFQTLQLFPLRSDKDNGADDYKETELPIATMNTDFIPCQFFEFLPLKN